jgi:hypothetical protein
MTENNCAQIKVSAHGVTLTLGEAASRLGGEIIGPYRIRCPGPGRPPEDRSLMVTFFPPYMRVVEGGRK